MMELDIRALMLAQLLGDRQMPPLGESIVGVTTEGRPAYLNADGSLSTERTVGVAHPAINAGQETTIPTIFENRQMRAPEAVDYIVKHGSIPMAAPGAGLVVDPVTGRRLEPDGPNWEQQARARSAMIRVLMDPAYKPIR